MLRIVPLNLRNANALMSRWHRHHRPARGCKFSIGMMDETGLHGAAICSRPSARMIDQRTTIEVTRLVTDGTKNACSMLYATAARIAREMGYETIITYVLEAESGHSIMVAGWEKREQKTDRRQWKHTDGKPRRTDHPNCDKWQWFKSLTPPNNNLQPATFVVGRLAHNPLQASLFADESSANHGGDWN